MSSPQCPEDFNRAAALPADENPYPEIDIVRFEPSISKMLDCTMVEHAFGTKLTFHRNAPLRRVSNLMCGKGLSENGFAVAEAIETRGLASTGEPDTTPCRARALPPRYNRIAMKYGWGKDRGDGDNNHSL